MAKWECADYTRREVLKYCGKDVEVEETVQSRKKVSDQTVKYLCNQNTKANIFCCLIVMEK